MWTSRTGESTKDQEEEADKEEKYKDDLGQERENKMTSRSGPMMGHHHQMGQMMPLGRGVSRWPSNIGYVLVCMWAACFLFWHGPSWGDSKYMLHVAATVWSDIRQPSMTSIILTCSLREQPNLSADRANTSPRRAGHGSTQH